MYTSSIFTFRSSNLIYILLYQGAAVDDLTCARIIFDQIFSVLNAIYTTVDTFTTGGAASAGQNAADKVEDTSKSSNKIAEAGKKAAAELTKVKESVLNFYKKFPTIKKGVEKVTDTADKFNDKLNKLFGIKDKSKFLGFEKMKLVKLETKAKLAASYAWKMKTFVDWTNKTSQVDEVSAPL